MGLLLGLRTAAYVLVFIAFLFAVIGIMTPSPTTVGMESRLDPETARGMVRITRHPFLWGVGLWAATHLVVNGDLASLILFGTFLVLAIGGTAAIDAKRRRKSPRAVAAIRRRRHRAFPSPPSRAAATAWHPLWLRSACGGSSLRVALYAVAFYLHGRAGAAAPLSRRSRIAIFPMRLAASAD